MSVTIIEQRDTNFGPAKGYQVAVASIATKADLDREFAGIDCLVYMDRQLRKIILSNQPGYSYDRQRAETLVGKVENFLEDQSALKRKRQVRDALNKCANPDIVEKVAKLLNV